MTNAVLSKLRALVRGVETAACEQCGQALAASEAPVLQPEARRLLHVCLACADALSRQGSGVRYLRVQRRAVRLTGFQLPSRIWRELEVPVGLAFFRVRAASGEVLVTFPGRAGLIEAFAPLRAWRHLEQLNLDLCSLRPDVEALLVRRTSRHCDYFRVSMDYCYELSSLVRSLESTALNAASPELPAVESFFQRLEEVAESVSG
jgi:hypothetical protein